MAEIARLYQTMNLTVDEIRWRLEQLISLRFEVLEAVYKLTGERRRFSFYEIARAARLLDGHFPDSGVAAEVLAQCVSQALTTGVPLVDVAYMNVTTWRRLLGARCFARRRLSARYASARFQHAQPGVA